jgi:hypothetical protein
VSRYSVVVARTLFQRPDGEGVPQIVNARPRRLCCKVRTCVASRTFSKLILRGFFVAKCAADRTLQQNPISCPSTRCESSVRKVRLIDPRTRSHICSKCEMPSPSILTLRAVDFETGEESQSFVQCDNAAQRPSCSRCGGGCRVKDYQDHVVATLFGRVTVRLPRFCCAVWRDDQDRKRIASSSDVPERQAGCLM